jgi:hypothetical protein
MNDLDYLTEAPHSCASDDVNAMAFEETTKIIGGHDAVEEYLACGIVPLSNNWSLKIERAEALLLKVIFPLSKVAVTIGEQERNATFEMRIVSIANHLVRNYGPAEHRACMDQLCHGCLNCVSELTSVKYLPRPEPSIRISKNARVGMDQRWRPF